MTNNTNYSEWLESVDNTLYNAFGLTSGMFPETDYYDLWAKGTKPGIAAASVVMAGTDIHDRLALLG